MKSCSSMLAVLAVAALATPAFASDDDKRASCLDAAKDKWMTEDAIKAKATEIGYKVANLKTEDGCYEIYASDKDGKKVEVFMHPVSGDVVYVKADD